MPETMTEPTAKAFTIYDWSAEGWEEGEVKPGMTVYEMIHANKSIKKLLYFSEVYIAFDIKGSAERSDCRYDNVEQYRQERKDGKVSYKEEEIVMVLVCLRLSYKADKPRYKHVSFQSIPLYEEWRTCNDKLRSHAMEIALHHPKCLQPMPPFPNHAVSEEARMMILLWLSDYRCLILKWFVDDVYKCLIEYDGGLDSDDDLEQDPVRWKEGSRPQGVTAIMVSIAKRFKLSIGMSEDDDLDTLEYPHNRSVIMNRL